MNLILDEKACLKHKMTIVEVLAALAVRHSEGYEAMLQNLYNREVLVKRGNDTYVTQHWSDVLDEIICDSQGIEKTDEEVLELAKKMRQIYPEGKMRNKNGEVTPYYYRCNDSEVAKALKRFFTQNGNYTDEEILDATRRYVADFQGQYWQKGMRLLKYFIIKNPIKQGENGKGYVDQVSDLETYLCNKDDSTSDVVNDDEWMLNSRN